jgi:ATP:corrinoid adenosyltransferase
MKKLIDKAVVVAEIEKIYNEDYKFLPSDLVEIVQDFKDDLLIALDTLEVKEVDLETELNIWRHNHFHGRRDKEASGEYLERVSQLDLAKHFFELGIKTQKGE